MRRKVIYVVYGTGPAGEGRLCWTESEGMAYLLAKLLEAHYKDLRIVKE